MKLQDQLMKSNWIKINPSKWLNKFKVFKWRKYAFIHHKKLTQNNSNKILKNAIKNQQYRVVVK